jgi:hypothetical protein
MSILRRLPSILLPFAIPLLAMAAGQALSAPTAQSKTDSTPLIEKVRAATERYRELSVALAEGFVQGTPCVSGPDTGAMGVHFVMPARINGPAAIMNGGVLQADQPEALIYEPLPGGAMRLVGVEYIVLAGIWASKNPAGSTPALDGDLLNYIAEPNRFGLPAFYEIHVWAWEHNPKGSFADWNTHVSCEEQPST